MYFQQLCDVSRESLCVETLTLVLLFPGVVFAGEKGLVVLSRQVHIVIRQRLLVGGVCKALVLGAPEQVHGIPPHLTL